MNALSITNQGEGLFHIAGDLTFATIDKKTVKDFSFLNSAKTITLDLSAVNCTDSAGLALMIEWLKYCRKHRIHLRFKNIPEQMRHIAQLSGFDQTTHFAELS